MANGTRTQAERSAATREALLDATVECLVDHGYAGTTTARVAQRAGCSRGAHLHHFQTRSALVAAAVDHLSRRRGEQMLLDAAELPECRERTARGLDLLWESYASPLFQAALDLWSHARTDPELRAQLLPVERTLDRQTVEVAHKLFPHLAGRPDFERLVVLAVSTVRGLALSDTLQPGEGRNAQQWPAVRAMLVELFEQPRQ